MIVARNIPNKDEENILKKKPHKGTFENLF